MPMVSGSVPFAREGAMPMSMVARSVGTVRLSVRATKGLVVFHRWIGVALCLFFAMWFATGAVMIYVPYPFLGDGVRIARDAGIAAAEVTVSPAQALAASGVAALGRLRLLEVNGRAVYVLNPARGAQIMVSATTGQVLPGIDASSARAIAEAFSGSPVASVAGPVEYDQWMVHHRFDRYRPFYRVTLADEAGTDLYVSGRSGEVMQRTTGRERAWNSVGAVLHWIYPTVLRKSWVVWDRTVWWLSLVGVFVTLAGIWLGLLRWRTVARSGRGGISPYRGWMKWHHVGGLLTATFVFTWMFSGWLSMDHGRLFSTGEMTDAEGSAYAGLPIPEAAKAVTPDMIKALLPASEVEVTALAGKPYLVARGGGHSPKVAQVEGASILPATASFPEEAIRAAVRAAFPGAAVGSPEPISTSDVYANLRSSDGIGTDGVRVPVRDGADTAVYVNPITGKVIEVMDTSRRAYRWLYFGLHTLDFPFLRRDAVWTPLMLLLLAGGFAFSVTGITIGWRRIVRKVRRFRA